MKRKSLLLVIISSFLLSGCDVVDKVLGFFSDSSQANTPHTSNNNNNNDSEQGTEDEPGDEDIPPDEGVEPTIDTTEQEDFNKLSPTTDYVVPKDKVGEFYGGLVNDNAYLGYEFTASLEANSKPTTGVGEVKIYSFNDFHGAVLESDEEPGLKAFASYYKEKSVQDNTLIFDQGDTWQGTLESNYSYGGIVQDVFNYAGVSSRTVGNHDFDWGLDHLEETINRKLEDDYIPCLASNVYDYANGKTGTTQQSKYGKEYATFVLENGIKVGVIGVIGSLTSSICSNRIETVNFTSLVVKAKRISNYLRVYKNCDIVVLSTHNGVNGMRNVLTRVSPISNKRYVDIVLGGHEHTKTNYYYNGVVFSQSDSQGRSSAITTLKYDFQNNCLLEEHEYQTIRRDDYKYYSNHVDETIEQMVDGYLETVEEVGNEVLSTHFSGRYDTGTLATLMCEAIFYKVREWGYDIDFSNTNGAREEFEGNVFTFRDLYRCFPFDNEIVLMEVRNTGYNRGYRPSDFGLVDPNKEYYSYAIIDYVALHQDYNREYDLYPDSIVRSRNILKGEHGETITYRDILKEFLLDNPDRDFSASSIRY